MFEVTLAVVACLFSAACGFQENGDQIPDLAFHRARHAFEKGRWDWARVYLEEDLKANPDRHQSVRDLAVSWISGHGGGLAQGVPFFERYLEAQPNDQAIRRRLIVTLIRLGEIERGLTWAEGLDDHPDARYLRALLLAGDDPREALVEVLNVVAEQGENSRAHALTARLHEELGNAAAGAASCRRSLDIDPFSSKTRARYERLLKKTGSIENARAELRALEIVGRLNQSREAAQLGPAEELHLLRELESTGSASGFLFNRRLAKTLLRSGHLKEGWLLCGELIRDDRFSIEDRLVFARILVGMGERQRARQLYESVLDLDKANVTARSSLAILDCGLGLHDDAIRRMESALAEDPFVATYHATLAQAQLLSGQEDAAAAGFETALELAPWEDQWRKALADFWRARGEMKMREAVLADAPPPGGVGLPVHTGRVEGEEDDVVILFAQEPSPVLLPDAEGQQGWWVDVSAEVGLDFVQYDGRSGHRYYVETTASGCGFFDFDDDGDLDVYLLTGAPTPGSDPVETPRNGLFENLEGRFVDVTEQAGVGDDGYGMGMCVGDIDGDGLLDFLVANYGPDRLYRNLGGGRFEETSRLAGVDDPRWSSNCAFGDVDGDGDLDLYVSHYLKAGFKDNPFCGDRARNISAYCRPSVFSGVSDSLFINSGDGTFTEEGARRGVLQGQLEKGFGVVLTDLDDDSDLDIFLANDSTPNRLYLNDGQGFFDEIGLISGLGLNSEGMATSGMGADIGDIDGDLRQDLVLTNYAMESNGLYRNMGDLVFEDVSRATGLSAASRPEVGWGARLADFDNDGDLDLAIANGHVVDNIKLFEPDNSYGQRNRILLNDGSGTFSDVSAGAGAPWREAKVSRALTIGDWNNDGKMDLLIANANDRFELLENRADHDNHWLGLKLVGRDGNIAAIGARVVASAPNRSMMREVRSGTGFQSQGDLRLHFGLSDFQGPVTLEVLWPDGSEQVESVNEIDRYVVIRQR